MNESESFTLSAGGMGLRDAPIERAEDDKLGLAAYVDALSEFVLRCPTPMTIAIQGDWGSGKTSTMNLVRAKLKGKVEIAGDIWFNTWQYSQFGQGDDLPAHLIGVFAQGLKTSVQGNEALGRIKNFVAKVAKAAVMSAAAAVTSKDAVDVAVDVYVSEARKEGVLPNRVKQLKDDLDIVVKAALRDTNSRYLVFIDDLDRLIPSRAVEVLEVLKIFLDVPGCVFLLACDYEVITRGLREKFGEASSGQNGKHFFDKIIQLPFTMPVGRFDVAAYIRSLFGKVGDEKTAIPENEVEQYRALLANSIGFNPRSLKRITNSVQILYLVASNRDLLKNADDNGQRLRHRILFGLVCLQTAFEPLYRHLLEQSRLDWRSLAETLEIDWQHVDWVDGAQIAGENADDLSALATVVQECNRLVPGSSKLLPSFMSALRAVTQIFARVDAAHDEELKLKFDIFHKMLSLSSVTSIGGGESATVQPSTQAFVKHAKVLRQHLIETGKELSLKDITYELDEVAIWIGARFSWLRYKAWIGFRPDGSCVIGMDAVSNDTAKGREDGRKQFEDRIKNRKAIFYGRKRYQFLQIEVCDKGTIKLDPNSEECLVVLQKLMDDHFIPVLREIANTKHLETK